MDDDVFQVHQNSVSLCFPFSRGRTPTGGTGHIHLGVSPNRKRVWFPSGFAVNTNEQGVHHVETHSYGNELQRRSGPPPPRREFPSGRRHLRCLRAHVTKLTLPKDLTSLKVMAVLDVR